MTADWEWLSAADMAAQMEITPQGFNKKVRENGWRLPARRFDSGNPQGIWRPAKDGGGYEYHYSLLPGRAQSKFAMRHRARPEDQAAKQVRRAAKQAVARHEAWAHFDALPDAKKAKARWWLETIESVLTMVRGGTPKEVAVKMVCDHRKVGVSTYYEWEKRTHGIDRADWLAFLVDRRVGRTTTEDCDPDAWEFIKADFLRAERPSFAACFRRLERAAKEHGWKIPSARTLERRLLDLPVVIRVLAREGRAALKRLYPAQERDRSGFHAMEAVNADGHKWDVWVQWPDGEICRPNMVAIQDLYSGLILSWRIDKTANKEAVRLAIGDMVEQWGIPDYIWLDNGRDFASKWITGGTPNRYRFKVKEEEPAGILTQLGVEVHWTTPYSGQSKPIERAFRDFCDNIAKHPALAGAWTGNTPLNKPENYGSKAIPLEKFIEVVAEGIVEHNTRKKRRSKVCQGIHSFLDAFQASCQRAETIIRESTEEQRRLWLLAAECIKADAKTGEFNLMDNRYWSEFLIDHRGTSLVVRFDPQNMHAGAHVYRLDGAYLGFAECKVAAGFNNIDDANEHNRKRKRMMRATREALEIERSMSIDEVAKLLPKLEEPPPPETKVVRPFFGNLAVAPVAQADPDEMDDEEFRTSLAGGVRALRLVKE